MRNKMTKEIQKTSFKVARMQVADGKPEAVEVGQSIELGNVSDKKLTKLVKEQYGQTATFYDVERYTEKYEMNVTDFLEHATLVTEENESEGDE